MTSRSSAEKLLEVKKRLNVAIAKLKKLAAECTECGGTRMETVEERVVDCHACADILETIEDLEMPL